MADDSDQVWLHLFTSSLRELYISDAIDLLAAPSDAHFRFRYEERYLSAATRKIWDEPTGLRGYPVVVYFSLQHQANFHPAVFIPLRRGEVVRTLSEGPTYVVYFRLKEYLPLPDETANAPRERAMRVRTFSEGLRALLPGTNPDDAVHATIGGSPLPLVAPTENFGRDFHTQVRFLTPSIPSQQRTYFRVASITSASGKAVVPDDNGAITFVAGTEYVLNIAHYHYEPLSEPAAIAVAAPPGLTVVGEGTLTVRSRYDVIPIRLFPPFRENVISDELSVKTVEPTRGPTVRIPLIIKPAVSVTLFAPALGFGAASAIAMPPILAAGQNLGWRIAFVLLGSAAVGLGLWWRRARGLGS